MKKTIVFFFAILLFGCNMIQDTDTIHVPDYIKKKAEKKFGRNYNEKRINLGLQKIPDDWHVTYHENYELYFSKDDNVENIKGYACKIITYDEHLNILTEEDYYRSFNQPQPKLNQENCDDDHLSFKYDFKNKQYDFDGQCCFECVKTFEVPWEDSKEGHIKKLKEVLKKMGY